MTGNYAGTPVFMPPEQITNFKYVKPVSDVWSFAASLYQLLTGKFPYRFDPKRDPIDIILNENNTNNASGGRRRHRDVLTPLKRP